MSTTTDRESRSASRTDSSRAELRRRSEARQAGSKSAEESEATELRTLLTRLGDGAEEAERREKVRGRALRVVAAGTALVLVSAGAGVGLTLIFGGPAAKNASDFVWLRPAEPSKRPEPGPLPAPDAAMASRTDKLTAPVAGRAEPQLPDPAKPVASPAVQAPASANPPVPAAEAAKTASVGSATGAIPARASGDGKPDAKRAAPPAKAAAPAALSEPEIAAELARAEGMLKNGDLAAARSFFRRIADAGDARGALGMARSYDPEYLKKLGMHGLRPDRAAAQDWYARAQSLKSGPGSE